MTAPCSRGAYLDRFRQLAGADAEVEELLADVVQVSVRAFDVLEEVELLGLRPARFALQVRGVDRVEEAAFLDLGKPLRLLADRGLAEVLFDRLEVEESFSLAHDDVDALFQGLREQRVRLDGFAVLLLVVQQLAQLLVQQTLLGLQLEPADHVEVAVLVLRLEPVGLFVAPDQTEDHDCARIHFRGQLEVRVFEQALLDLLFAERTRAAWVSEAYW